uniref:flavodoxin family protein n=1 Tax=uncultured Megasphaera sp. TaxID=165188 RepID=UPI00258E5509
MNKILFINGSPNENGNTARLAHLFLKGHDYDTLNLVDLKIYSYGQHFADDQYQEVIRAISSHEVIVVGSPMYWHSMSGAVRNVLDRAYGIVMNGAREVGQNGQPNLRIKDLPPVSSIDLPIS